MNPKIDSRLRAGFFIPLVLITVNITGCMMAMHNMHRRGTIDQKKENIPNILPYEKQVENAVTKLIILLKKERLSIDRIAVGEIYYSDLDVKSIDAETIVLSGIRENFDWLLIDRKKIEVLIKEQQMGISGLVDETTAPDIGKVIGINNFLFLSINLNEEIISVSLKIIDVSSGKILWIGQQQGI